MKKKSLSQSLLLSPQLLNIFLQFVDAPPCALFQQSTK